MRRRLMITCIKPTLPMVGNLQVSCVSHSTQRVMLDFLYREPVRRPRRDVLCTEHDQPSLAHVERLAVCKRRAWQRVCCIVFVFVVYSCVVVVVVSWWHYILVSVPRKVRILVVRVFFASPCLVQITYPDAAFLYITGGSNDPNNVPRNTSRVCRYYSSRFLC